MLLGDGAVRGTGGRPEIGARLAAFHEKEVRAAACGGDLTFVIAGLGGGTGTGLAPLVANWARIAGSVVVGVATMPFRAELHRQDAARRGLEALRESCSSLIILDNDRLLKRVPDLPVEQAFAVMDHMVGEVIRGLVGAVNERSLIQLDFPDLTEILREGGTSTILFGEGDVYAPDTVVASALKNALLDADSAGAPAGRAPRVRRPHGSGVRRLSPRDGGRDRRHVALAAAKSRRVLVLRDVNRPVSQTFPVVRIAAILSPRIGWLSRPVPGKLIGFTANPSPSA